MSFYLKIPRTEVRWVGYPESLTRQRIDEFHKFTMKPKFDQV